MARKGTNNVGNADLKFCETCSHQVMNGSVVKCGLSMKTLRFYDRACDRYEPILAGQAFEWDKDRRMYVIR